MAGPVAQFVQTQQNPQRERELSALRRQPFGPVTASVSIVGEKIRSSSAIGQLQLLPYLDQWSQETYEHRRAYPLMMSDPIVKPALLGKIYAIASLDLQMTPAGETERDEEVAAFCQYAYTRAFDGGFPRLAEEILLHGWMFGTAIVEPVMSPDLWDRGKWQGKRFWKTAKAKELDGTNLVWDEFKNIVGVRAMRFGQNETFPASDFLIFRNNPMYGGPGTSEFRAAYAAWWRKNTVEKIRAIYLEKSATGMPVATYENPGDKESLEETMANLKDRNWAIVPKTVQIELLTLAASGSSEAYDKAIKDYDEKICLAISGAFLQMLTANSGKGEMRGNSQSQKGTAELFIWHGSAVVGALIDQFLTPALVRENFIGADFPAVKFGGVNDADLMQSIQVDQGLKMLGFSSEVRDLNSRYARKLKEDPPPDIGDGMGGPPGPEDDGPYDSPEDADDPDTEPRTFAEAPGRANLSGWWKDASGRLYLWQNGRRIKGNRNRAKPEQARRKRPDQQGQRRGRESQRNESRQDRGQNQAGANRISQNRLERRRDQDRQGGESKRQDRPDGGKAADSPLQDPDETPEAIARAEYKAMGTRSPAFKKWFGDWENPAARAKGIVSKVIDWLTGRPTKTYGVQPSAVADELGKPIVVYHGTPSGGEFEAFDPNKKGSSEDIFSSYMGPGFYFTESKDVADDYTAKGGQKGANPHRFEVYLNIKNPFDADAWAANIVTNPGLTKLPYQMMADHFGSQEKATEYLKSQGFDGITHLGGRLGDAEKHRVWIAFEPTQVKAVKNRGTFDAKDGRMKFSEGLPVKGMVRSTLEAEILVALVGDAAPHYLDLIEQAEGERTFAEGRMPTGYTGYWKDKLGRNYYFVRGKRTKRPAEAKPAKKEQGKPKAAKPKRTSKEDAHAKVAEISKGDKSPKALQSLLDSMAGMTVKQLTELKKKHGLKASGTKAVLVKKLAERLHAAMKEGKPEKAKKESKTKPEARKKKENAAATDFMQGHPLADMTHEQAVAEVAKYAHPRSHQTDPWGLASSRPDPGLSGDVMQAVNAAKAKSSFARPTIKEVFDKVREKNPDLALLDFQKQLVGMSGEGKIVMTAYTQAPATNKDIQYGIPLDKEIKNYLDMGSKPQEKPVSDKPTPAEAITKSIADLTRIREFEDGLVPIDRVYGQMTVYGERPDPAAFKKILFALEDADKIDLVVLNEVRGMTDEQKKLNPKRGDDVYGFVMLKEEKSKDSSKNPVTPAKAPQAPQRPVDVKPLAKKDPHEMTRQEYLDANYPLLPALQWDGKELTIGRAGQVHHQVPKPDGEWWNRKIEHGWVDKAGKFFNNDQAAGKIGDFLGVPKGQRSEWVGHSGYIMAALKTRHEAAIKEALVAGKPVPPEVLAEYPDLAAKYAKKPKKWGWFS